MNTKSCSIRASIVMLYRFICTAHAGPPQGQLLASMCFQCHGTNGLAVGGFESIAGKSSREIYKELLEMSKRKPEGIMDYQARAYTPNQILHIANYLATLPKQTAGSTRK
jgi:sulfide dehydrogenase cytochrome subunit